MSDDLTKRRAIVLASNAALLLAGACLVFWGSYPFVTATYAIERLRASPWLTLVHQSDDLARIAAVVIVGIAFILWLLMMLISFREWKLFRRMLVIDTLVLICTGLLSIFLFLAGWIT